MRNAETTTNIQSDGRPGGRRIEEVSLSVSSGFEGEIPSEIGGTG